MTMKVCELTYNENWPIFWVISGGIGVFWDIPASPLAYMDRMSLFYMQARMVSCMINFQVAQIAEKDQYYTHFEIFIFHHLL